MAATINNSVHSSIHDTKITNEIFQKLHNKQITQNFN